MKLLSLFSLHSIRIWKEFVNPSVYFIFLKVVINYQMGSLRGLVRNLVRLSKMNLIFLSFLGVFGVGAIVDSL